MTDFDHINSEIESIEKRIEMQYEKGYDYLTDEQKNQVCLDHFFKGDVKYSTSAEKLRVGLDAYRSGEIEQDSHVTKITYRDGRSHYQLREKNGRFGRWLR